MKVLNTKLIFQVRLLVKRLVDIVLSFCMLVILAPFFLIIALAIKLSSPGAIIFKQERIGRHGKPFTIYKFRSMVQEAPSLNLSTYVDQDDPRLTQIGKFLRKSSLDELPQLLNILNGDMSFVGPRPDLPHHVEKYNDFHKQRLYMKPGVTGWAQINGRNQLSWEKRIKLDVEYIQRWSLTYDLYIMLRTILVVLSRKGTELPKKLENQL